MPIRVGVMIAVPDSTPHASGHLGFRQDRRMARTYLIPVIFRWTMNAVENGVRGPHAWTDLTCDGEFTRVLPT